MQIQLYYPSDELKPFVKQFWVLSTGPQAISEPLYPTGYLELAINISEGNVTTVIEDRHIKMPNVEVFGQLTLPGKLLATKGSKLLITRFYPHAFSLFFPNQARDFTNDSIDLNEIFGSEATGLYENIMKEDSLEKKIAVLERFLVKKIRADNGKLQKMKLVRSIYNQVFLNDEPVAVENLAQQHGYSERYIQKLFVDFIGVPPKQFLNIQRFNRSLELIRSSRHSLTSIAYECGYYDQAHFIKSFKGFSGLTPSQFKGSLIPEY
jgi:AraC-like DNA-binding protein